MGIIYKHGRNEVCLPFESSLTIEKIYNFVTNIEDTSRNNFYLTFNGKYLQSDNNIKSPCTVRFHLRLPGGKGGFGSMLRAIGARIEKTTNHEACRDLSGRRMRDVNHEKQIGEWMKHKEGEEEERKQKRIKKLEKILNPKHNYEDKGYTSNLQNNAERIDEALKSALQKRDEKCSSKRKIYNEQNGGKHKKNRMWIGVNDESDDSENDCENIVSVGDHEPCCSKGTMDNLDDIDNSLNDEKHNECEAARLKESHIDDDVTVVSDTNNIDSCAENTAFNTTDVDSNTENTDSSTTTIVASVQCTMSSNAESVSSNIATNDDTESNLTNKDACNTNIDDGVDNVTEIVDATSKDQPIDINDYDSPKHLESAGLDSLKTALMAIGLKCGGTLQERAQRLFLTKNTPLDKLDRSLFAKQSKGKNKKKNEFTV